MIRSRTGATIAIQLLAVLCVGTANAVVITGSGVLNVDNASSTSAFINTAVSGSILDLDLYVDLHASDAPFADWAREVEFRLIHGATSVLVHNDVLTPVDFSGYESKIDAVFDDETGVAVPALGDLNGTFQSAEALSAFDGLELSGEWELQMTDPGIYPGDGTDLVAWELRVETRPSGIPEPSTALLLGIGVLGAGLIRRKRRS